MELKELRKQALVKYILTRPDYDDGTVEAFNAGAEWELERDKWHNAGGEVPPKSPGGRSSERVLVEYKNGDISAIRYDHGTNKWRTDREVVKWAFIP